MQNAGERRTLLSIEFTRTETNRDPVPLFVVYEFFKTTPFGVLQASATVDYATFVASGAAVMDGQMFTRLGEELNREELNRILEMGANANFGVEGAAA